MSLKKFVVAGLLAAAVSSTLFAGDALSAGTKPAAPASGAAPAAAAPAPATQGLPQDQSSANRTPAQNWLKVCDPIPAGQKAAGQKACILRQVVAANNQLLGSFLLRDDPGQENRREEGQRGKASAQDGHQKVSGQEDRQQEEAGSQGGEENHASQNGLRTRAAPPACVSFRSVDGDCVHAPAARGMARGRIRKAHPRLHPAFRFSGGNNRCNRDRPPASGSRRRDGRSAG